MLIRVRISSVKPHIFVYVHVVLRVIGELRMNFSQLLTTLVDYVSDTGNCSRTFSAVGDF